MKKLTVLVLGVFLVVSALAFSGCAKKAPTPKKPAVTKKVAKPAKKVTKKVTKKAAKKGAKKVTKKAAKKATAKTAKAKS